MRTAIMAAAAVSDILLPSFEDEAAAFGDTAPDDTARRYADCGAGLVVVKNGADEMIALDKGQTIRFTPAPVTGIVDTTAADDSFNAAFLAAYLERTDLAQAIRAGAELAAKVISKRGALVD
ncbi:PfkB family carbohydrate kinase [Hoeflea alexandrii]|uniref:PfkB family carbohydrate kinase n=1 Tax=Hoeflea alexandrii TaxID=288436 RepID=UPI002D1E3D7E|nr:PfkB family carbohydrate kinase [Hoeflea alexandrii]